MRRSRLTRGAAGLAAALAVFAASPATPWVDFSLPGSRLSVRMPAAPRPDAKKPGRYSLDAGDVSWMVEDDVLDETIHAAVARDDRAFVRKILETLRDEMVKAVGGTLVSSDSTDHGGFPSMRFAFRGEAEGRSFEGAQRVVMTSERMYTALVVAPRGALPAADVDTFLGSLRVARTAAAASAATVEAPSPAALPRFRDVDYWDAVCRRLPALPVTFSLPSDYESRSVGHTVEGGCLWGTKEDLDRVTAVPEEGDFSSLRRGVFRARVSTNVVCSPQTGVFDSMDGSGEEGLRAQLSGTGATVVTWKKETRAGLPALQIVADLPGAGRVYMLYLGNTRSSSNVVLVNYYQPKSRTAADDEIWARFVSGIRKAGPTTKN